MPALPLLLATLLMVIQVAPGQVLNTELGELNAQQLAELRKHLNISDSLPVTTASPYALATANSIRVFLAVGSDPGIRRDFVERISRRNLKNRKKYRRLEIVDRIEDAEVLLVQISRRLEPRESPAPTMEQRAGVSSAPGYPMQLPPESQPRDLDIHTTAYVIARGQSRLEILARVTYLDRSGPHPQAEASKILCEYFFKLVQKY